MSSSDKTLAGAIKAKAKKPADDHAPASSAQAATVDSIACISDPARVAAVRRTGLLDTPPEEAFDRLTRLAAKILDAPVALISLLDEHRLFFKSSVGISDPNAARDLPLAQTFCQNNITFQRPLVIEDAHQHPLVCDHPAVATFGVGGYLGVPLFDAEGHGLGVLCVIDHAPRAWNAEHIGILEDLAASVITAIELRSVAREADAAHQRISTLLESITDVASLALERDRSIQALSETETRYRTLFDSVSVAVFVCDRNAVIQQYNRHAVELWGREPACGVEQHCGSMKLYLPDGSLLPHAQSPINDVLRTGIPALNINVFIERPDSSRIAVLVNFAPLVDAQGEIIGAITSFVDITAHKQAEDGLRHQNTLFAALTESVLDGILIVSTTGNMLHANQRFLDIWKFPPEIIAAGSDEAALHWAAQKTLDPQAFLARVAAIYTDTDTEVREEVLMKDGRVYERFGAPIRSGATALGWLWTFRNITERKQVEERLRESEQHYRLITQTATDVIINIDANSIIMFINDAVVTMFGYTAAELLGKNLSMLMPEAMRQRHSDSFKRYLATGKKTIPWTGVELCGLHKDGTKFPLDISFGESTTGAPTFTAIIRDITARKQAETVLRESETRFRTLADNISQFAWMTDETGYFFWYNQRWFDYTGTTLDKMQGWGWQSVHHPDYVGRVTEKFRHHLETGEAWEDTFPLRSRDGEFRWFLSRALPITDEQGKVMRWFGTNTDITDQRVAELQMENYAVQLQRSNRELQDFAAAASHDLQEPLRKIQTFGDRLRTTAGQVLNEQGQDYLARMQKAALRMQRLINDLLSFSRVATKTQPFVPVDLSRVVHAAISDLEVAITETDGHVEVGDLPVINADPTQMQQLLQNLIGNALKFHKPGEAPLIKVTAEVVTEPGGRGQICRLSVADNGIGFDEKYLDRIFTVFERLHGRSEYEGTGIGLAICRRITERHGGSITAISQPGQGANFTVSLPVEQLDST